jgi:phospholipase/lecithinase/hemolysin
MDMLRRSIIAAAAVLSISAGQAFAGPYSAIYSFGDSLSDVGNAYIADGGTEPVSPYYQAVYGTPPFQFSAGVFSNGPIWVQDLGKALGLPVTPSFAGGNDYAVGGAITGDTYFTVPGGAPGGTVTPFLTAGPGDLPSQVDASLSSNPSAPSSALYTLSIGANDLFAALTAAGDHQINAIQAGQIAYSAAQNVAAEVGDLKAAGAKTL